MDVDAALALTTAAASAAAGGAATAAGESAWQSLLSLSRRLTGRGAGSAGDGTPLVVDPGDEDAVRVLLGRIDERARADEEFAGQLCRWAERHGAALRVDRSEVHNTIAEGAQVSGTVIQARDIQGGIHLG